MNEAIPTIPRETWVRIRAALPKNLEIYLVGGAVRDIFLGRATHDLDFALVKEARKAARSAAAALDTPYYTLDEERDTGRVILNQPDGVRLFLDFAVLRGTDLVSDLQDRDFTINAMAIALDRPDRLIDPLGGANDLREGVIRACSVTAFRNDPVRILRAVRQAVEFGFHIQSETRSLIGEALPLLPSVSAERLRDELFRILEGPQPATALRALDILGVLPYVLPELPALKGIVQPLPHVADVWEHSLGVAQKLSSILKVLAVEHDPETAANLSLALISVCLGRFRKPLHDHHSKSLNPDRSLRGLVLLAALYHDVGKAETHEIEAEGRIRFRQHEFSGERLVSKRAHALHLSNGEIARLKAIVRGHMRPLLLAQTGEKPSRRAVYRFFRDTGEAGVDICLLSLADTLATYGPALPQDVWSGQLDVVRTLLEAYWEQKDERISPPPLLTGHDLIEMLKYQPGPGIGKMLDALREAQAAGEITNREQALEFARRNLEDHEDLTGSKQG